jgi:hypothetical protein
LKLPTPPRPLSHEEHEGEGFQTTIVCSKCFDERRQGA